MKVITAILICSMALLCNCIVYPCPPEVYNPPQPPQFGANEPQPMVMPQSEIAESQLNISNVKIVLLTDTMVALEFNTNIPATSSVKLLKTETEIAKQIIAENTQYHYYKFEKLKQSTPYIAIIEANSPTYTTYDKTIINFTTVFMPTPEPPQKTPLWWIPSAGY